MAASTSTTTRTRIRSSPRRRGATSGSFTIPTTGETSANVWYRIYLTVRDSGGLTQTTQRDVLPRKSQLTLATNPAGLQLRLDGQPVSYATRPSTASSASCARLEAPATQVSGGTTYEFVSWSDGGARIHDISTPATNTTYTATYRVEHRRYRQRTLGDVLQQHRLHRHHRHAYRSDGRFRVGNRIARRRRLAPTRSARAGPVRSKRSSPAPTRSTRRATMGSGCG